jgi:hypothetical protein
MEYDRFTPEDTVHVTRIVTAGLLGAIIIACAGNPKPRTFGTASTLTPTVEILGNDRVPLHLRLDLPESAHIAAFYVLPGAGTQMLFPADSTGSKRLPAGSQEITTAMANRALNDSSRLLRRPQRVIQPGDAGVTGQDIQRGGGLQEAGFVVVYASQDSLDYKTLAERVIGVSLPGYQDEAFNTVNKLVRSAARGSGPWTAIAVPFHR